jgi:phosphoglycerol transferase MdoB-like AlkP superfamily enzyme
MEHSMSRQVNPIALIALSSAVLYVSIGMLLRIVLTVQVSTTDPIGIGEALRVLGLGLVGDSGMSVLLCIPLLLLYPGLNEWKYRRIPSIVLCCLLWLGLAYVSYCHTILNEYGGGAPKIARIFLGWKAISFYMRTLLHSIRDCWRKISLYFTWGLYVFLILFLAIGEYVFWDEFASRFNFIAVDYLIYTNEVVGNIVESYNMTPIVAIPLLLTVLYIWLWSRNKRMKLQNIYSGASLARQSLAALAALALGYGLATLVHAIPSDNSHIEQLEQNGDYNFVVAFKNNTIDYAKYYPLLPEEQCRDIYQQLIPTSTVADSVAPSYNNIVLVTVESLSAKFLNRFGNDKNLTPALDSLARLGWSFDSLYANGNRTVRGLEALSLCLPPAAGESVIKRPENAMGDMSVGAQLSKIGYDAMFVYGGDSYFDNMGDFFSNNGYTVIDRKNIAKDSVTFANIWGVCDEDLFAKTLSIMDNRKADRPAFVHVMTTSNHRPYTYPEGRVKGSPKTRDGAVRYTDVAIERFMREASKREWFDNTIFIIIADHCASSAGKTNLPVDGYHIPCVVYAPGRVKPMAIKTVCSQIDVLPTVFAMCGLPVRCGAGADVLSADFAPRALMATYQDLGYYADGKLTVLSPVRKVRQYAVKSADGTHTESLLAVPTDTTAVTRATALYQYTNLYLDKQVSAKENQ